MHTFSKLYHADFVCPSKGQTSVVLSSIFLPQSIAKRIFHDTSGGTFRIIIDYQESIIASFEDIWQSKEDTRLISPTLIHFRNPESLFSTVPRNL